MANIDVIDLDSSDDEAEPEPKKAKTAPNVMVQIPRKLPGVTIKPTKHKALPVLEKLAAKPITITKVKNVNPYANTNKNIMGLDLKKRIMPMKVSSPLSILRPPILQSGSRYPGNTMLKNPIRIQKDLKNSRTIRNLPPNITVRRTTGIKKPIPIGPVSMEKLRKPLPKKTNTEVPTVELDDDDCPPSTGGPQWYLRPEETTKSHLEEENNREPEKSKIIEITIEDSPVKMLQDKRAFEVGTELAITIEDSPIKQTQRKQSVSGSDDEGNVNEKELNSKKKLNYPNNDNILEGKTIEIELEPIVDIDNKDATEKNKEELEMRFQSEIVEVQENSPRPTTLLTDGSEKSKPKTTGLDSSEVVDINEREDSEFHPVYQNFIDLCLKLENSDDMNKIVEKKIKAYYKQVPKEYTESEMFIDMVSSKILSMKAGPEKLYLYIKDVVDELNLQRKLAKSHAVSQFAANTVNKEESNRFLYGEDSEFDSKRQRQIRKLEKTLKKLHRAIQLLEEQEVDFDDEDDSVYLLTERYKERMVRVHAKFCQLTNTKMPSEPRVQIDSRPGQPAGPAKRLEKWINRKVPIGTPLPFPDFHDVVRCVREANEEDKLGWNEVDIMEEARDLFTRCGKKLQRRRQENEWRLAASRITLDEDPAEKSPDLKKKLESNKHVASKKEAEVFNKYVDRQNLLKLEAEEIGDKEAEESPVESEEEENNDEVTLLLNKEKRKERLKRLIQEKSNKSSAKKEKSISENKTKETEEQTVTKDKEEDDSKEIPLENKNKLDNEIESLEPTDVNIIQSSQDKIHSLSDESDKINSDIDELHLLEKLHSGKETQTSSLESSDSETPISISDTLSSGDNKKQASDVISIENSSYSESEPDAVTEEVNKVKDSVIEIDNSSSTLVEAEKTFQKTNNNEYSDSVENILLASSDEENMEKGKGMEDVTCINLENDSISSEDPGIPNKETPVEDSCNLENDSMSMKPDVIETGGESVTKEAINLENDSISTGNTIVKGEEPLTRDTNHSDKDSMSIGHTEIPGEQILLGDKNDLENKSNAPDIVTETKQVSTNLSVDLKKDSICIDNIVIEKQQILNNDAVNLEIEPMNSKEVDDTVEHVLNKDSTHSANDLTIAKESSITIGKDTKEINGDIDMTHVSDKEQSCPVDEIMTEKGNCHNESSIKILADANDFSASMETDVIDDSLVTEKEESLVSNMEVDELPNNTSTNILV